MRVIGTRNESARSVFGISLKAYSRDWKANYHGQLVLRGVVGESGEGRAERR